MTSLWTSTEILEATGGTLTGPAFEVSGVSIDSRTVGANDLFIALHGPNHDGHDFAADAAAAGARLLIHRDVELPEGASAIRVDDTFAALYDLARTARTRTDATIIAVTGSVGKTGTKEALKAVFSRFGATHAPVGSFNNHWGVPLTLARMPRAARTAIFEIGMNHAGEIRPLAKLVRPHLALITTIAPVHLEHFSHLDDIAHAKAEIFEGLVPGGQAVLPFDSPYFGLLTDKALGNGASNVVGFGDDARAGAHIVKAKAHADCTCASAVVLGEAVTFKLGLPGRHLLGNALAVLTAAKLIEGDLAQAAMALAELEPPEGRGRRYTVDLATGPFTIIDESYNASPPSIRAALETLGSLTPDGAGRRIVVLGDMLELGPASAALHAGLAPDLEAAHVHHAVLVGPHMAGLHKHLSAAIRHRAYGASEDAADHVAGMVRAGDIVMIKGSNGMRLRQVVEALLALDDTPDHAGRGKGISSHAL